MGSGYKNLVFKVLFGAFCFLLPLACGKDNPEKIAIKDREKIVEYLEKNNMQAIEDDSGIFYIIDKEGSGDHPKLQSRIKVSYTGMLLDGKVFDARSGYETYLYQMIQGWRIAVPKLKRGGSGTFFIPSGLGYGIYPTMGIPANSVLKFEIELIDFFN